MKPTSSPSSCERTERTRIISRVIDTSTGLFWAVRLVLAVTIDLELDLGVCRPAHLLDGFIERKPLHRLLIEMRDDVVCHDPSFCRRGFVGRRNHFNQAFLHIC